MHFYNKRQRVVVKTEGLRSSGLPEAVACGCGRSSNGLGRPAWQSSRCGALQCGCRVQHKGSWRLNQSLICIRNFVFILIASVTG